MIDTPHIVQSETQQAAAIHLTVPRVEIQNVMGPAIGEVYAALMTQGIKPTGPWFTYHTQAPSTHFDFNASVPVATPIAPTGRVINTTLTARRVARTIYQGDYAGLGEAWGELRQWITDNGHKSAQDLWECYLVGPDMSQNPADWRTELNQPLLD